MRAEQDQLDQDDGEEDGERIIGAGFDFKRCGDAAAQLQATRPHQEKYRCGIGRADNRAKEEAFEPGETEDQAGDDTGQGRSDDDAQRRQNARRQETAAKNGEPGPQAPVKQDDRQSDGADQIGQTIVVEDDAARPVLSRQHADDQEYEKQGSTEARGDEARCNADENEHRERQESEIDEADLLHDRALAEASLHDQAFSIACPKYP